MTPRLWIYAAIAGALIAGGFWGGWWLRDLGAREDEARATKAAYEADKASSERIGKLSGQYEEARKALDAARQVTNTKIREIYRDVPAPPAVCAAPPAARRLLIDLGATGPAPSPGQPRG